MSDTPDSSWHPILPAEEPIVRAFGRIHDRDPLPSDVTAYHYTSPAGLLGILKSQRIHMGSSRHMNDPMEGSIGDAAWDAAIKNHDRILNRIHIDAAVRAMELYVASFSLKLDDLSQWRGYGAGGCGFALGFNLHGLAGTLTSGRVIYDPDMRAEIANDLALALASTIEPADLSDANRVYRLQQYEAFCRLQCRAFFKSQAYSVEAEVRVIAARETIGMPQDLFDVDDNLELDFRATPRGIVPYLDLRVESPLEHLREVVLGPLSSSSETIATVRHLLNHSGYPNATITPSAVPLR